MKSFESIIDKENSNIRDINAIKTLQAESYINVERMKQEYRRLQNDLENCIDSHDLNTRDASFIINSINDYAQQMMILARKIKIAVIVHNTLFPTNIQKELSDDELDFLKGHI